MKTINICCANCGKEFTKALNEYNRRIKNGHKDFYCTRSCFSKRPENIKRLNEVRSDFKVWEEAPYAGDELTPFKHHYKCLGRRKKECTVTLEDLKEAWEKQKGICPFTGWQLELKTHSTCKNPLHPKHASIDRIDNSKGYTKENIRWVSVMFNFARNKFEDDDVLLFCNAVSDNQHLH
jgi:DNA-directed RNA polymerase subunit N (RpoN/RPB10)